MKLNTPKPFGWQTEALKLIKPRGSRTLLRIGRQAGKTTLMDNLFLSSALRPFNGLWVAPDFRRCLPSYERIRDALADCGALVRSNGSKLALYLHNGAKLSFQSLNDPLCGRGLTLDLILGDEVAFSPELAQVWNTCLEPTLATRPDARVVMASTPNSMVGFFYDKCTEAERDTNSIWRAMHLPSSASPLITTEYLERIRPTMSELVFRQEYLAEFVDFGADSFYDMSKFALHEPSASDVVVSVFATADMTAKGGVGRDGSMIAYWAHCPYATDGRPKLYLLDWDYTGVVVDFLDDWFIAGVKHGVNLAKRFKSAKPFQCFVEDKAAGSSVILPVARKHRLPVQPLPTWMSALSKSERAIRTSTPIWSGKVALTGEAKGKQTIFENIKSNHFLDMLRSFTLGRASTQRYHDEAVDCLTYALLLVET